MEVVYFPDSPDGMWKTECSRLVPYLDGLGLDVGAGRRSISREVVRLDLDPIKEPDVVASGDAIPFPDGQFDFIVGIHSFEHLTDPVEGLKEWLRVIRPGGIIAVVHPDLDYTKPQKKVEENVSLQNDPFNKHYHEFNQKDFLKWLSGQRRLGFKIIASGDACSNWSFYFILQKNKAVS